MALTCSGEDGSQGSGQGAQAPQDPHDASLLAGRACARREPLLGVGAEHCGTAQSLGLLEELPTCISPSFHFTLTAQAVVRAPPPR